MQEARIIVVGMIFTLFFVENGEARSINSTKKIKLKEVTETYTISIRLDSAKVTIGLNETRQVVKKLKNRQEFDDRSHQEIFDKILAYLSEEKNHTFYYNLFQKEFIPESEVESLIVQYALTPILGNGKAKVLNSGTGKFEESILCLHYRTHMAGEQHEGYEFKFTNGKIFLWNPISI